MTLKKTVSKSEKIPAKRKTATARSKAAPPRMRPRKKVQIPTEDEIRQKAYALWESRGRPMGSPDVDWFEAVVSPSDKAAQAE